MLGGIVKVYWFGLDLRVPLGSTDPPRWIFTKRSLEMKLGDNFFPFPAILIRRRGLN